MEKILQFMLLYFLYPSHQLFQRRSLYFNSLGREWLLHISSGSARFEAPIFTKCKDHDFNELGNYQVTQLFSTLVKVAITAVTLLIGYLFLHHAEPYKSQVSDLTAPMVVIGVIAFSVSWFFVAFYSDSMEAIYTCYLVESETRGEDKAMSSLGSLLASKLKTDDHQHDE